MEDKIFRIIERIRRKRQMRLDADSDEEEGNGGGRKHSGYSTKLPYGIANDLGIDTKGMTPREVWDKIGGEGISHSVAMSAKNANPGQKVDLSGAGESKKPVSKMTSDSFPDNMTGTKIMKQETDKFCGYVNDAKGTDSLSGRLYRSMKALHEKCKSGVIRYAERKHVATDKSVFAVRYSVSSGRLIKAEVRVPKITNEKTAHSVAHEMAHYMDALGGGTEASNYMSTKGNKELTDAISKERVKGADGIQKERVEMLSDTSDRARKAYSSSIGDLNVQLNRLNEKYNNKEVTYEEYIKEWRKVRKDGLAKASEQEWKELNGEDHLMDMYDAMSGGVLKDTGVVCFGHGRRYYSHEGAIQNELFANYCTLQVFRPDLLKHFENDFPETAKALQSHVDNLLKLAEG